MESSNGCGTIVLVAVVVGAFWLWGGNGWTTVRKWLGQDVYEDQRGELDTFVKRARVGSSGDVWLVKRNFGTDDRVALFFGYVDDWSACYEFADMYMRANPADTYVCQIAN